MRLKKRKFYKNAGIQSREGVAHPKDEIQHKDHVFHARADVRKIIASPAIIHHYIVVGRLDGFRRRVISVLRARTQSGTNTNARLFQLTATKHNL